MSSINKMTSNRNKIKQYFVTFPQSGLYTKTGFLDSLPPVEYAIIAQEEHENGGYHLHASIKLLKPISKSCFLKWFEKKYPMDYKRIDVQPTRVLKSAEDYIKKEDPEPLIVDNSSKVKKWTKDEIYTLKQMIEILGPMEAKEYCWDRLVQKRANDLRSKALDEINVSEASPLELSIINDKCWAEALKYYGNPPVSFE